MKRKFGIDLSDEAKWQPGNRDRSCRTVGPIVHVFERIERPAPGPVNGVNVMDHDGCHTFRVSEY